MEIRFSNATNERRFSYSRNNNTRIQNGIDHLPHPLRGPCPIHLNLSVIQRALR